MRREKLEHLVTNGIVERKIQQGKTARKDIEWINKVAKYKMSDNVLNATRNQGMWKISIAYAKEQGT